MKAFGTVSALLTAVLLASLASFFVPLNSAGTEFNWVVRTADIQAHVVEVSRLELIQMREIYADALVYRIDESLSENFETSMVSVYAAPDLSVNVIVRLEEDSDIDISTLGGNIREDASILAMDVFGLPGGAKFLDISASYQGFNVDVVPMRLGIFAATMIGLLSTAALLGGVRARKRED